VRGHEGVLGLFPARTPEGSRHAEQVIALTWIERPGVCIQVVAANLTPGSSWRPPTGSASKRSRVALAGHPADGHRFGPTNSSSRATLPRLATDRLQWLFGRHSIPSWSQARPKIPRMSADTLLKW
jgi:hypothetical protein